MVDNNQSEVKKNIRNQHIKLYKTFQKRFQFRRENKES